MLDFTRWTAATADLPWGAQRVFHDTLKAVADEQVTLAYGADYHNGSPCLVNAVASMLTTGGGHGVPATTFTALVSEFDALNRGFEVQSVNTEPNRVSPLAAEILLKNFAPLKKAPVSDQINEATKNEAFAQGVYREPNDQELMQDWLKAMSEECAAEIDIPNTVEELTNGPQAGT